MKKIIQNIKALILKVISYFFEGKGFVDNFLSLGTKLMSKLNFVGEKSATKILTIENQEFNRKQTIKDELKAAIEEAERDKENSTVQRFIRNFESRVYAELSRQLIANLFGETPSDSGVISLEGNTIEYSTDGDFLTLRITEADGTVTVITIPIGSFTF